MQFQLKLPRSAVTAGSIMPKTNEYQSTAGSSDEDDEERGHSYYANLSSNNANNENIVKFDMQAGVASATLQQQQPQTRYKTELCRNFSINGTCNYGKKCQYAHGRLELNIKPEIKSNQYYKTRPCKEFFSRTAICPYGQRCKYTHFIQPKRGFYQLSLAAIIASQTSADQDVIVPSYIPRLSVFQFAANVKDSLA